MPDKKLSDKVITYINRYANGREVVMYGKDDQVKEAITASGFAVEKIFTGNKNLIDRNSSRYFSLSELKDNSDRYYVVLPFLLPDGGVLQRSILQKCGFKELEDFVFYNDTAVITKCSGNYSDPKNNVITGRFSENLSVVMHGKNNSVLVGSNVKVSGRLKIEIWGNNNKVIIGENCLFESQNELALKKDNSEIDIGNNCIFRGNRIGASNDSYIKISDKCDFGAGAKFTVHPYSKVFLGVDCMISWNAIIQTGDGHSIFNLDTGENINSNLNQKSADGFLYNIALGEHVWICRDAMIFAGGVNLSA